MFLRHAEAQRQYIAELMAVMGEIDEIVELLDFSQRGGPVKAMLPQGTVFAGTVLRGKSSLHSASRSNRLPGQTNIHSPAYSNAVRPPGHGCRTGKLCFKKRGVCHRECTRQAVKKDYMPAFSYYSPRIMRKMPRR